MGALIYVGCNLAVVAAIVLAIRRRDPEFRRRPPR